MTSYAPAKVPTFYFIGVTTSASSIMKVFPKWADYLGLDVVIAGIDLKIHDDPERYREVVSFIKNDPLSLGALVTTHKIDLFKASRDMFDFVDPHAELMGETSCLSKRDIQLRCHAKDPISAGLAIDGFLGDNYFKKTGAEVFSIGAGGSTIALTWHLAQQSRGKDRPSRIIVSNRSAARLEEIERIHKAFGCDIPVDYILAADPSQNDAIVKGVKPGSLIINATGLGKDAPGSPLTDGAAFPDGTIAWDLNYRGNLIFLDQARNQPGRNVRIEDGWTYFLHGWTQVMQEVFDRSIATSGPEFEMLSQIAIEAART